MRASLALVAALAILAAGCGVGLMQSARTTPAGTFDVQLGAGYVHNDMVEERGRALGNFPLQLGTRYGISERVDVGAAMFMGLGALVDVKANLVGADQPLAVAVQGGLGGASGSDDGSVIHLPLRLLVSYDLWSRAVTPYAGAGLGLFWVFGYDNTPDDDGQPVARAGHGDGVFQGSVGVEIGSGRDRSYFLEYSFWRPILDDPGDGYAFADNHIFMAGTRW